MIYDLQSSYGSTSHNGRVRSMNERKTQERSVWELLAWAILEQAVDDLVIFARYGLITQKGKCLPWPTQIKMITKWGANGKRGTYPHRVYRSIAACHGPNEHRELVAWFKSDTAQEFCDWIGCKLPAKEIFEATLKNHGGLTK